MRVTDFVSSTSVGIEVVKRLHQAAATKDWEEGRFSDFRGWPAAVALFESRLWFAGNDKIVGSVSDDFDSFDLEPEGIEGDSASIQRSVATGPVNRVVSLLALSRLCLFTTGSEPVGRSSSFDEVLTPANFGLKDASTQGSAAVQAIKIDKAGIFIQKSGTRAYLIRYDVEANDYGADDLTRYHEDVLASGVKVMAVQRQPDTRVWFVLNNGTAVGLVFEPKEDVISWFRVETDGLIEDVSVLPNNNQDDVYFIVNRNIGGTKRYVEKLAYDSAAVGGSGNQMADAFISRPVPANKIVTGLTHLASKNVVVWAGSSPVLDSNGDPKTYAVSVGGQITATEAPVGTAIVGLPYEGMIKGSKNAYGAQLGTAINQPKRLNNLGAVLYKTHINALRFGQDFERMAGLPRRINNGPDRGLDYLHDNLDARPFPLQGSWDSDARLCIKARAPMPATVMGLTYTTTTNDGQSP